MREKVSICDLLLEKYGDWDAICEATSKHRYDVELVDAAPWVMSLGTAHAIACALGMSTAELVQLVADD